MIEDSLLGEGGGENFMHSRVNWMVLRIILLYMYLGVGLGMMPPRIFVGNLLF